PGEYDFHFRSMQIARAHHRNRRSQYLAIPRPSLSRVIVLQIRANRARDTVLEFSPRYTSMLWAPRPASLLLSNLSPIHRAAADTLLRFLSRIADRLRVR